jgi:tape measure domain-containing protein
MAFKLAEGYVQLSSRGMGGMTSKIANIGRSFMRLLNPIGLVTSAIGGLSVAMLAISAVKVFSGFERFEISMRTLLGSAELAKEMSEKLDQLSLETPFDLPTLQKQFVGLKNLGFAAEEIIPILGTLSDATAAMGGTSQTFDRIAMAISQMKSKQKITSEEMTRQLGNLLPAWELLANKMGITVAEVQELGRKGALDANKSIQFLIEGMAARYAGAGKEMTGTVEGMLSNIRDHVFLMKRDVGKAITEAFSLKSVLQGIMDFVPTLKAWGIRIVTVVAEAWGKITDAGRWAIGILRGGMGDLSGTATTMKQLFLAAVDAVIAFGKHVAVILLPIVAIGAAVVRWANNNRELATTITRIAVTLGLVAAATLATSLAVIGLSVAIGWLTFAMALLLTPIGLVIAGVAIMVGVFQAFGVDVIGTVIAIVENWDIYWRLAWEHTKLAVSNMWERLKTFFVNIGHRLTWMWNNWKTLLVDMANLTVTVFKNIGHNIWQGIKEGLSLGAASGEFKKLADGFKATTTAWPDLITADTRKSTKEIDRLNKQLNDRLTKKEKEDEKDKDKFEMFDDAGPGGIGGKAAGGPAKAGQFGFTGLVALAERMQDEALKSNDEAKKIALAEKNVAAAEKLAGAVEGGFVKVKMVINENPDGSTPGMLEFAG